MSRTLMISSLILGSLSVAIGYGLAQNFFAAGALLGFALLWLLAHWRKWRWFASLNLGMAIFAALVGLLLYAMPLSWLLGGVELPQTANT